MIPTRSSVRAKRTRATILQAALQLFKDRGFVATTMRDIAQRAGMAVGATYYHFRNKDEIVFAFYEATQEGSEEHARKTNSATKDFSERLREIIEFKLAQLDEYRGFLGQLAGQAIIPNGALSPFSEQTSAVRVRAIALFDSAIHGSDLKVGTELRPHLPMLLWLYQMAIILYWLHDSSTNQMQTKKFITLSQTVIRNFIALSRIPVLRQLTQTITSLIELFSPVENKKVGAKA